MTSTPETLDDLVALTDKLKERGVRSFSLGRFSVNFAAPEAPPLKEKASDGDACNCGHPLHHHNNGLCLIGCEPDKCAGPEGKP